jgi:hypothetical protein
MKNTEIIERLKNGEAIRVKSYMIFKRNKIVRGSSIKYTIGPDTIRSTQFETVRDLLEKDYECSEPSDSFYRLKTK